MKKLVSILLTLAVAVSLLVVPAVAADTLAQGTTYEIVGDYNPVDFTVTDDDTTVTWTFDMIGDKALSEADKTGGGRWNYGLAISLDGVQPALQIHNNDGADNSFAIGTHLYSQYLGGWQATIANTPVDELDWVTCTGDAYISPGEHPMGGWPTAVSSGNPDGIFTVTIDKAELGLDFYWAIWCTAGGFWDIGGYSSYPEDFMWDEDVTAGHYEPCSLPANTEVGLTAETPQITAINVDPASLDFGTVMPGDTKSGLDITVCNIGTVTVNVDAYLDPLTGTVFNYLELGGVPSAGNSGDWSDYIINGLKPGKCNPALTTQLVVPSYYSAKGEELATLIFEAVTL